MPIRISEIVLRTARYEELRAWYQTVLSIDPYLDTDRFCFRRLHSDYPYTQLLVIFHRPELQGEPRTGPGLDHMQFRCGSLGELLERYARLKTAGIVPHRAMNHGPGMSLYYRDPDGNVVEFSSVNFKTEEEYVAYVASEKFRSNISGIPVDPDDLVMQYRNGVPAEELVRIP